MRHNHHHHHHYPLFLPLLLLLLLVKKNQALDSITTVPPDKHDAAAASSTPTTRVVFGSCHKTKYKHDLVWKNIHAEKPHIFLWSGDAVYTDKKQRQINGSLYALKKAYENMTHSKSPYTSLLQSNPSLIVEGTWDDHDYGENDGGLYVEEKDTRQTYFLNFLNISKESPRRKRKGVYSSHRYLIPCTSSPNPHILDVIFLDTRSFRDDHLIRSIGGTSIPLGAVLSTFTRLLEATYSYLTGFTHSGDVLGEQQWKWLEKELKQEKGADVTLVVSSIQVLTKNPMVESWMHFPKAKERLLSLLSLLSKTKTKSKNLFLISGDVHYGEMMTVNNENNEVREITSSGLTHSCADPVWGRLCPLIHALFGQKRATVQKNYGTLEGMHLNIFHNFYYLLFAVVI